MDIQIIMVPYDLGHLSERKGKAPDLFVHHGLDERLRQRGHIVGQNRILLDDAFLKNHYFMSEIGAVFEINRRLARHVQTAVKMGRWPLVLAGNCNSCIGTLAGLAPGNLGVIWMDVHGDFNTPETTLSGYIDGMCLSIVAGHCWQGLANSMDGFKPIAGNRIIHVGAGDLDKQEHRRLEADGIMLAMAPAKGQAKDLNTLASALRKLPQDIEGIYLHLDMDVLLPGGLALPMVRAAIQLIKQHRKIKGCTVASYDPKLDVDHRILLAGIDIILDVVSGLQ